MLSDFLAYAREQAERFGPQMRAGTLLRIARVSTTVDRDDARRTFEQGLEEWRSCGPRMDALRDVEPATVVREKSGRGRADPHIRCPKCRWSPRPEDRWMCKCGYVWNTFDTGGVCPGCHYQWTVTKCLACKEWSAHSDWYA